MRILAQDLGTTTGFAAYSAGGVLSGSWSFKPGKFDGGGLRFLRYRKKLDEFLAACGGKIDLVVYEGVRAHKGVDAAHIYGGLMGTLTAWCEENGIPYEGVDVGAIKRFATGKGNANKEAMMAAVAKWGYELDDDNHADALALLHLKIAEHELPLK